MTDIRPDIPGVIAPPPLIFLATLFLGSLLDFIAPAYILTLVLSLNARMLLGFALLGGGIWLLTVAMRDMWRAGTPPEPWKPVTALVASGIFGRMRNPMYVGMSLMLAGLAVMLASNWTLVLMVPMWFVLHSKVVLREEAYLEARFGEAYRDYKRTVSRYGWLP